MCRSLNRRHRTNPPRRYVAECRKVVNNRPKSRGRDRRPRAECSGLAAAAAPVPAVTSPGNGKMARQHSARWIAGPSERTTGNRSDRTGRLPTPRTARSGDPETVGADVLLAMAGMAARQGTEPPEALGFLRRFLGPYYHLESIRSTTLAIGWGIEQHSRTGFDSASMLLENESIRGQGIIARGN